MVDAKNILIPSFFFVLIAFSACKEKRWDKPVYNLKSSPLPYDTIEDPKKDALSSSAIEDALSDAPSSSGIKNEEAIEPIEQEQAPTFEVAPPLKTSSVIKGKEPVDQIELFTPPPILADKTDKNDLPPLGAPPNDGPLAPLPVADGPPQPLSPPPAIPPAAPFGNDLFSPSGIIFGSFHAPFSICGNGIVEPREQCDDGNDNNYDGCNVICRVPLCGNGLTELFEECDDGNFENNDGCTLDCIFERCGNGRIEFEEQCDDGNRKPADGCSPCCRFERCGNGIVDPYEQCDDGNTDNTDFCDDCCKFVKQEEEPDPEE